MLGGFLGAGKTTAVLALARHLRDAGRRVGLITNDQSIGLVDTAMLRAAGFDVQEIAGGCFCCRFDSLVEASRQLEAEAAPDVFIAEPVGSCTDLVATVSYPLQRIYGQQYRVAPLSVLVDPIRAMRVLGLQEGRSFSEKVIYVYRKQLEEADLIVINKIDLLNETDLQRLTDKLQTEFPAARVLAVSTRDGVGLEDWFSLLESQMTGERATMEIDYNTYAEGEALMGWLNATLNINAAEPFDGEVLMMELAERMQRELAAATAEIAHLKMTLLPRGHDGRVAVLNIVDNSFVPELAQSLVERMRQGQLLINLRAEADPVLLEKVLQNAIAWQSKRLVGVQLELEHMARFRPSPPQPTWRMPDAQQLTPFAAQT
ncbi:cobalamin biosynthesis protein P47K [Planctomycetales bacterium ZRK34]|nr:cobalamin biosynthesis protein P47K [Planctomycetales bacterium ZRK34]